MSEPRCTDCGGIHYGSVGCPYYRSEPCIACTKILAHGETRKFDLFGRTYHTGCTFLVDEPRPHIERLAKLVKRLNPGQFVDVDVEILVHLLAAHKMLEKLPDAVKQQYSIASELDADKWDAEFREKFRGRL
jgi:hypothetical protein